MSLDRYHTQIKAELVYIDPCIPRSLWTYILGDESQDSWVDICQVIDYGKRYYFPDLASALDFYLDGWKKRQFLDEEGKKGIDHIVLCSRGHLIHERFFVHGDAPEHDGDNLRRICAAFVEKLNENEKRGKRRMNGRNNKGATRGGT